VKILPERFVKNGHNLLFANQAMEAPAGPGEKRRSGAINARATCITERSFPALHGHGLLKQPSERVESACGKKRTLADQARAFHSGKEWEGGKSADSKSI